MVSKKRPRNLEAVADRHVNSESINDREYVGKVLDTELVSVVIFVSVSHSNDVYYDASVAESNSLARYSRAFGIPLYPAQL